MRVLIAGLFVYIGLIGLIIFISNQDWVRSASPIVFATIILIAIFVLIKISNRLFNKKSALQISYDDESMVLDPNTIWDFKFLSSTEELLRAELAERQETAGMSKFFRGAVILMGIVWVTLPIIAIERTDSIWQPVLSELLGIFVLYTFVAKPILIRRKIKKEFPSSEELELELSVKGFRILSNGNRIERNWEELVDVLNTPSGIMFYWMDETKNWLPIGAIGSSEKYQRLAQFIANKLENHKTS